MRSPGKGHGLWTLLFLPKHTVIGVYTGWIVTDINEEVPARFAHHTMKANDDGSYRFMADPQRDVTASHCY